MIYGKVRDFVAIHTKVFVRNLRNCPIKILLITFCQVGLEMLDTKFRADRSHGLGRVRKSRFTINRDFSCIKV